MQSEDLHVTKGDKSTRPDKLVLGEPILNDIHDDEKMAEGEVGNDPAEAKDMTKIGVPERIMRFVRSSIDLKYMDWQESVLIQELADPRFHAFAGLFKAVAVDYRSLYERFVSVETEVKALRRFEATVSTAARLRYGVRPTAAQWRQLLAEERSEVNEAAVKVVLEFLEAIPQKSLSVKEYGSTVFGEFISFNNNLAKAVGIHVDTTAFVRRPEQKPDPEASNLTDTTDANQAEAVSEGGRVPNKKAKKALAVKANQERVINRVELKGVPLILEVLLFTMLSKTRIWHKLIRSPSSTKSNRIQLIADWFKGFQKEYSRYIIVDSCPWDMELKDLRTMRNKIYYAWENNGYYFELAEQNKLQELKDCLDTLGLDINMRNGLRKFKGLLHIAAKQNNMELLNLVLKYNPDLNIRERHQMTPLYFAIEMQNLEMIVKLLDNGADVEARDEHEATPIYWSVYCAQLPILQTLVKYGAKPDVDCMMQRNCLIKAAFMDKHEIVRYLLTFPSVVEKINDKDQRGRTPLHAACWGAKGGRDGKRLAGVEVPDSAISLELLLDAGADVGICVLP